MGRFQGGEEGGQEVGHSNVGTEEGGNSWHGGALFLWAYQSTLIGQAPNYYAQIPELLSGTGRERAICDLVGQENGGGGGLGG